MAARTHGEAEPILANARARMHDHAVADERVHQGDERSDVAIAPDGDAVADHGARRDARAPPDARLRPDDDARLHDCSLFQLPRGIDERRPPALAAFGCMASG